MGTGISLFSDALRKSMKVKNLCQLKETNKYWHLYSISSLKIDFTVLKLYILHWEKQQNYLFYFLPHRRDIVNEHPIYGATRLLCQG